MFLAHQMHQNKMHTHERRFAPIPNSRSAHADDVQRVAAPSVALPQLVKRGIGANTLQRAMQAVQQRVTSDRMAAAALRKVMFDEAKIVSPDSQLIYSLGSEHIQRLARFTIMYTTVFLNALGKCRFSHSV